MCLNVNSSHVAWFSSFRLLSLPCRPRRNSRLDCSSVRLRDGPIGRMKEAPFGRKARKCVQTGERCRYERRWRRRVMRGWEACSIRLHRIGIVVVFVFFLPFPFHSLLRVPFPCSFLLVYKGKVLSTRRSQLSGKPAAASFRPPVLSFLSLPLSYFINSVLLTVDDSA